MRLDYRLEVADLLATRARLASIKRSRRGREGLQFFIYMALGFALAFGLSQSYRPYDKQSEMLLAVWGLMLVSWLASIFWQRRTDLVETWLQGFAGNYELVISPEGVSVKFGVRQSFFSWKHVMALEETEQHWLLYISRRSALTIPKAGAPETALAEMRRQWASCLEHYGEVLPSQLPQRSPFTWLKRNMVRNLLAGARLACFRSVQPQDFQARVSALVLLTLLGFGVALVFDYQNALPEPGFSIYGVSGFALNLLMFILGGFLIASWVSQKSSASRALVMLMSGILFVDVCYLMLYSGLAHSEAALPKALYSGLYFAAMAWVVVISYRVMRLLYGLPVPFAWLVASGFIYFSVTFPSHYFPQQDLFYPGDERDVDAKTQDLNVEEIFYRQPQLVEKALDQLSAEKQGQPDLFFIGFAGEADEKVFANEVHYVQKLLDSRFGTAGHSLLLVNHLDTVDRNPLANTHNLELALKGLATRMDPEQDILFMYLTSHGSRDFKLSVSFWPLTMNDLPAARLRELLDQSGIRNRVIVVSACYSGGFVDALKDEHTVVMTAASRDKTSFGCGTESEYTYFGDAYFVKSLSSGKSFIDAFGQAKALIYAREKREGKEPSQPQIHVGNAIRDKLKVFEATLPL